MKIMTKNPFVFGSEISAKFIKKLPFCKIGGPIFITFSLKNANCLKVFLHVILWFNIPPQKKDLNTNLNLNVPDLLYNYSIFDLQDFKTMFKTWKVEYCE